MDENRVLVQLSHPAHVHFFKHFIWECDEQGVETKILVTEKDLSIELTECYNFEYDSLAGVNTRVVPLKQMKYNVLTRRAISSFEPDVVTSIGGTAASHASLLTETKSLIFTDTEHARLQNAITFPFADRICTPDCYLDDIGAKQVRYPGYHELAYLHPNRFEPDPGILDEIGITPTDRFVVLRIVGWDAVHDIGDGGFTDVVDVIETLEETGVRVFITAEKDVPRAIEHCQLSIAPHRIHHLLYYADLFIGESATMASESALLGTPAIFVSSSRRGYTDELEEKYDLVFNFSEGNRQTKALEKALTILEEYEPERWKTRREQVLADKIDTTEFIIDQVQEMTRNGR